MPVYRYRAIGATGEALFGSDEAANESDVASRLQHQGATVLTVVPAGRSFFASASIFRAPMRLTRSELREATRELASMLAAGQDIDRALRLMADEAPKTRVRVVLGRVRSLVRDGSSLTAALQTEPKSFSRLYIGLVRAGEAGGQLPETLDRLSELLERQRSITAAIQSAMIYPAVLLIAAVGSIVFLLTEVLPQFVPLFAENDVTLPVSTAFLLRIGNSLSFWGVPALVFLGGAIFGVRQFLKRPKYQIKIDRMLVRIPIIGQIVQEVLAARFTRTLGMLLVNGVSLLAALAIARDLLGNRAAQDAVEHAVVTSKSGQGMSIAFQDSIIFPRRMVQLLRLGEATAQLGPLALRAADIHEERIRISLQRLVALLVPMITILMGAAVAAIVSSLLLAMLSLNDIAQ